MSKLKILSIIFIVAIILFIIYKNTETFTNMAGNHCGSCESKTLKDCINCDSCVWCMRDGFDSQCVDGTADDGPTTAKCDKYYANDIWSRSVLSNDNNFYNMNVPVVE